MLIFGDLLRDARYRADLTQQQVAQHLHITQAYLSRLETNRNTPSTTVLADLCALFPQDAPVFLRALATPPPRRGRACRPRATLLLALLASLC